MTDNSSLLKAKETQPFNCTKTNQTQLSFRINVRLTKFLKQN
jgi:hypothetical protein